MTGSSGRLGLAGRDEIGSDPGALRPVGVSSVGVDCEAFVVTRAFWGCPVGSEPSAMASGWPDCLRTDNDK